MLILFPIKGMPGIFFPGLKKSIFNCSLCFAIRSFPLHRNDVLLQYYFLRKLPFGKKQPGIQFGRIIIKTSIIIIKITLCCF